MAANVTRAPHSISKLQILWAVAVALTVVFASSHSRVAAPLVVNFDKIAHFSVYGLLATLMCRVGNGWRAAAWAVLATSAFGVTDEWHQSFVPGRSCEVADWIADTTGAALAVTLYTAWHAYRRFLEFPLPVARRPVTATAEPPPTAK